MSKTPPIPQAQHNKHDGGVPQRKTAGDPSRDQSGVNLNERGASGNLRQNLTPQRSVQDR